MGHQAAAKNSRAFSSTASGAMTFRHWLSPSQKLFRWLYAVRQGEHGHWL
jgi:hypothetical protein